MRLLVNFNVILGLVLITGLAVTARMAYYDLYDRARQQVIAQAEIDDGYRQMRPSSTPTSRSPRCSMTQRVA